MGFRNKILKLTTQKRNSRKPIQPSFPQKIAHNEISKIPNLKISNFKISTFPNNLQETIFQDDFRANFEKCQPRVEIFLGTCMKYHWKKFENSKIQKLQNSKLENFNSTKLQNFKIKKTFFQSIKI